MNIDTIVSFQEICQMMGISKPTLYEYLKEREEK
ncbi:TPA: AlpA family phage regulatory protein [Legionella pneumophila]|nr:AlpA family phage regulatory protein [Legionella pneumophila]